MVRAKGGTKMAKISRERIYALRGWTVKIEGGKFYIAPTIAFQDRKTWKGPYKTLPHACTAIARKLQAEFVKRDTAVMS